MFASRRSAGQRAAEATTSAQMPQPRPASEPPATTIRNGAGRSIPRSSAPTRCSRSTPSASRLSRSTTRSTGCRTRSCWPAGAPARPTHFSFTLKAPRRITHDSKLQRCEDLVQTFCRTARTLGPKLGVLLFQLPPTFKKDVDGAAQLRRAAARRHARRFRVPSRVVARRRRLRRAARPQSSRCASPTARR